MGSLKTLSLALWIALLAPTVAQAFPQSPSERAQLFATCAGRFSALAEHQRFFDGAASEIAEAKQRGFENLLEAILPYALDWGLPGEQILDWRITAKMTQATLLHRGSFHSDQFMASRSKEIAETFLSDCEAWVLSTTS